MKITDSELQELITAMENKNLSISQVIELIEKSDAQSEKVIDASGEITLIVDYTKTVEQAITDGNYDWQNSNITAENFPISLEMIGKTMKVSAKLFNFNHDISSDNAVSEMDKVGYRPAALMELLAIGLLFPELQRQFPIVALGSIWRVVDGFRYMPCLDADDSERGLDLSWFVGGGGTHGRFLAVRK